MILFFLPVIFIVIGTPSCIRVMDTTKNQAKVEAAQKQADQNRPTR